jgi:hypothetical protein
VKLIVVPRCGLCTERNGSSACRSIAKGELPAAARKQNTDQKRNSNCVQGRCLCPTKQAVEWRAWLPACFNGVGNRLSGFFDRLGSRLNGLLGLVQLIRTFGTFSDHLSSPWLRGRSTPGTYDRSGLLGNFGQAAVSRSAKAWWGLIELPTFGFTKPRT